MRLLSAHISAAAAWQYALGGVAVFAASFVISLLVICVLLVKLPATYFLDSHDRCLWVDRHPVIRVAGLLVKNALGIGLILLGLALSVPMVPGQGLLTILIGLMLLDFPGKRRLERKILQRPRILAGINRLRLRYGRAPLQLKESPRRIEAAGGHK